MQKTLRFALLTIMFATLFSMFALAATRYECETAAVEGDKTYSVSGKDSYASGEAYAQNTNSVTFVYENVPMSNKVVLRCSGKTASSSGVTFKVKKPGETEWTTIESIPFEATTLWDMSDHRDLEVSYEIPEGSSFSHYCPTGINYDYIEFSYVEATEVKTGRIEAETCVEDMETYGWSIQSDSNASGGQMIGHTNGKTFTYKNVPEFNRLVIPVSCSGGDSIITVSVKTPSGAEAVLPLINHKNNGGWFMDTATLHTIDGYHFPEGSTVSLKIGYGVNLDYLDFYKVKFDTVSAVEAEDGAASVGSFETVEAEGASGGKYISLTSGTSVEYVNIAEANSIKMIYASAENGSVTVEVLENGEWKNKGDIPFATMMEETVGALTEVYSDVVYIPEGAAIRITANCKLIIDDFEFIKQIAKTEDELDETYLLAKNLEGTQEATVSDIMALVGTSVSIATNTDYTFTLPSEFSSTYNTLLVAYHSENAGTATVGGKEMKLEKSDSVEYKTTRVAFTENFTTGQQIVFNTATEGVKLDYIKLSYVTPAQAQTVEKLPEGSERITVSLNGSWNCQSSGDLSQTASELTVPDEFDNTIPVPGLWDMASVSLGSYPGKSLWYKKVVNMPQDFDPEGDVVVRLEILRALYGRHVYVNGTYVDSYLYNYTYSHTDITQYLKPGDNDIVIMLGSYSGQNTLENHVHTGSDSERKVYQPGITDNVNLILSGKTYTKAVQVAPDVENGKVEIQVKLEGTENASDVPVTVNFYELGVVTNGTGSAGRVKVGTYTTTANITADAQTLIEKTDIEISNFAKTKCWEPKNPYLYEIEVVLPNDTFSKRFGMKEFHFDAETKLPMLNGKVYYLRGTNIAPYRFYEDPQRGSYPWQEDWARKVLAEFKDTNWEIFRTHNGPMPSMWLEICDEIGMMMVDEYAIWGKCAKCTVEMLLPEYRAMVEEKQTNACVLYWDAQNEANATENSQKVDWPVTGDAIRQLISERVDIAERHWDNGWSNPVDDTQPVEYHPYPFISGSNIDCLNNQDNTKPWNAGANGSNNVNPKIVNEYASLWLNRVGEPTSISKKNYDKLIPDSTTDERFELYTASTAWLTEFYRSGRNIASIQHFVGLSYAKPGQEGATGDILMPDLSDPKIRPMIKDRLKSSFAPLGIILAKYDLEMGPGAGKYPIVLVNDYNYDITDLPVTFTVTSGDKTIYTETRKYSIKQAGTTGEDIVNDTFDYVLPVGLLEDNAKIDVKASYTLDGEEVYSLRTVSYDAAARSTDTSISQGKTVTVSSESAGYGNPKEYAVDGDTSTRWGGQYREPTSDTETPWICVDLGKKYKLMRSQVEWETAKPTAYEIQVSNDGVEFETVATVENVVTNGQKIDFDATARFVKIQALGCATNYSISIFEWYIWGDPTEEEEEPDVPVNVTTGKSVTASSESLSTNPNNNQPKENAVDGSESTRWGSQYRSPYFDIHSPWICVDMEAIYKISSLRINFEAARPVKFHVQTSLDGENFTTISTFDTPKGGWNEYEIDGTGRYLRILAEECVAVSGTVYGMSIFEIEAYGVPAASEKLTGSVTLLREDGNLPYADNLALLTVFSKGTKNVLLQKNIESSTTASSPEFAIELPEGEYDYCIVKNGYLQHNGVLTIGDNGVSFGEIKLIAGDIKGSIDACQGDGKINIDDFIRILRGFTSESSKDLQAAVDINEDRVVNVNDLAIIKTTLGSSVSADLYYPETQAPVTKSIEDTFSKVYFLGDTDKNPLTYETNETMVFDVTLFGDGEVISAPYLKYEITADDGQSSEGYVEAPLGKATIEASCSKAGYVRLKVTPCDSEKNVISASNISIFEGGACADFDSIEQSMTEPSDFDAFWAEQVTLLDGVTPTATESNLVSGHNYTDFDVYDVKIACVDGSRPVSGYISVPKNAQAGSLKLKAVYQGYGVDSASITCNAGYITFYINPHGIENGREAQYYADLKAGELSGFGFSGNTPAENSYFRNMILRDLQGVRYLKSAYADLWNGVDIEIQGGSMGAFQATAVASLLGDEATKLSIQIPWMCDAGAETQGRLGGWRPSYCDDLRYYDTVNFAKRVKAPVDITAGLGDYICPPSGITVLFKAITADKTLTFIQNKTHGYTPVELISYKK